MHAESVHVAIGAWRSVRGHGPEESVQGAGLLGEEVPCGVVRGGGLGDFVGGGGFDGVDEVREEDGVLDEEDGDVVADDV
jgi:hypothetical protein